MIVLKTTYENLSRKLKSAVNHISLLAQDNSFLSQENSKLRGALREILAQETKAPNATVSRILSTARVALGDGGTKI